MRFNVLDKYTSEDLHALTQITLISSSMYKIVPNIEMNQAVRVLFTVSHRTIKFTVACHNIHTSHNYKSQAHIKMN